MKKIIWLALIFLVLLGCRKVEVIEEAKPILVKVEAIHTTGPTVISEIVLIQ